jgi:hypothetical protein
MHPVLRKSLLILGILWALPMTLLGVLAGALLMPFGARLRFDGLALVFQHVPIGPGGALTLGNVILDTGESLDRDAPTYHCAAHGGDECVNMAAHERAHVFQYLALGVFFLPLYFACGGISHTNRFEQAADRYAATGQGWWPW